MQVPGSKHFQQEFCLLPENLTPSFLLKKV